MKKTGCAARSKVKIKSILTAGVVDFHVIFDSRSPTLQFGSGMHDQLRHWRDVGVSLSWETDGRMNMLTAELFDIIFMNQVEFRMYEDKGTVADAWINSLKHDLIVVVILGDVGAEAHFRGQGFFCKADLGIVPKAAGGSTRRGPG